jgi:methionyl-tRNA formyltransferase
MEDLRVRFAITATDRYLGVFQAFVERGWQPLKLFTTPVDNRMHHHRAVIDYAARLKIDVQLTRLDEQSLRQLSEVGCEALVVASYQWRIGDWRPYLKYAVNFHPSPLPLGRGPYPLPGAILENLPAWGVSCHKLESDFDTGDVLRSELFPLAEDEDHDSLDLKMQLAARRLAANVATHFESDWHGAIAQSGGSYHSLWTQEERQLDFTQSVEQILRRVRAFGPIETLVVVSGALLFVRRAVGWRESHNLKPGQVVQVNQQTMIFAVADGYIGLTEWSLIDPAARAAATPD